MALPKRRPKLGLALGGGGARGLAHVVALEAFDELGVRPDIIAGTSIGAIYGAAYASGLSAKHIRAHTEEALSQRFDLIRQVLSARADPVSWLLKFLPIRPAFLDPVALLEALLPSAIPKTFDGLKIPLAVVCCDFYAQSQVGLSAGDLKTAVAASMTLPVLFAPRAGRRPRDGGWRFRQSAAVRCGGAGVGYHGCHRCVGGRSRRSERQDGAAVSDGGACLHRRRSCSARS